MLKKNLSLLSIFPIAIAIAITFPIILSSCNDDNIKIALMLPNIETARFKKDSALFLQEAQKLGCKAVIIDAQYSAELQFKQAKELIKNNTKVLVIAAVNSDKIKDVVELAHGKGVKTIIYDGMFNKCRADFRVSFNDFDIGKEMAQYAVHSGVNGSCLILGGDRMNMNSVQINLGIHKVLDPLINEGKINITFEAYLEGWNKKEAIFYVNKYLRLGGEIPKLVIASNDDIAAGAIYAFEQAGLTNLPIITGQDASIEGCKNVMQGKQSITIYKPIQKLSSTAALVAYKLAKGEKIDETNGATPNEFGEIPTIFINLIPVHKDNLASTVIADGFHKESEIQ